MILNPVKQFTTVTVSCFDVPLNVLWQELELLFVEYRLNVSGDRRQVNFDELVPGPLSGGAVSAKGSIFTPGSGSSPATAMITNLVDGWQTLGAAACGRLGCACWQFTVSNGERYPRNSFAFIRDGGERRVVSAQLDTQWVFYAKGEILDVETESVYRKRRIKDRVTPQYVSSVAEKAGFPIGQDAFWATEKSSVCFVEGERRNIR